MPRAALLLVALCATAYATAEVTYLETDARPLHRPRELHEARTGEIGHHQDEEDPAAAQAGGHGHHGDLLRQADQLLGEHDDLMNKLQRAPTGAVVDLTRKIKSLQSDIKGIRAKKAALHSKSIAAMRRARKQSGKAKHNSMKEHITSGAAEQDLKVKLHQKAKELASLTIKQHDAASGGANSVHHNSAKSHGSHIDGGAGRGAGGADVFGGWLTKWHGMRTKLTRLIQALKTHIGAAQSEAGRQHHEVVRHMEIVKKTYDREHQARLAAEKKAKEFKAKKHAAEVAERKAKAAERAAKDAMRERVRKANEKKTKAVEAKQKQVQTEERQKKTHEKRSKELAKKLAAARARDNSAAIKEKERKAKAEIKRLQALNRKLKADCERRAKEVAKKAHERLAKSQAETKRQRARADALAREVAAEKRRRLAIERQLKAALKTISSLKRELSAAKKTISQLKAEVRTVKQALAAQKRETAKQIRLKNEYIRKYKEEARLKRAAMEKQKKAEARARVLAAKLKVMTRKYVHLKSKYTKVKRTMKHINNVSVVPKLMQN